VEIIVRHRAEVVITSVGSPASVIPALHDGGCLVLADVASVHHAERALEAGADGLVLLTAGAGGHTGWANPFAFVRAVRALFDGPIVLAGGLSDGVALKAATVLGCDLGSMGTRFIATRESLGSGPYKQMLARSSLDDVMTTRAFTGLPANFLRPSVVQAGLDPAELDEAVSVQEARSRFGGGSEGAVIQRWADLWSAGHSVSGVSAVPSVAELVATLGASSPAPGECSAGPGARQPHRVATKGHLAADERRKFRWRSTLPLARVVRIARLSSWICSALSSPAWYPTKDA
jgi:nitronate monooxygenase